MKMKRTEENQDEEAAEIMRMLAAESGIRVRGEDIEIGSQDRPYKELVANVSKGTPTYFRLYRLTRQKLIKKTTSENLTYHLYSV